MLMPGRMYKDAEGASSDWQGSWKETYSNDTEANQKIAKNLQVFSPANPGEKTPEGRISDQ